MNRNDLQTLAEHRIADAQALLAAGQWSGAYYLAGYAVECAFKACIARSIDQHDFPDKDRTVRSYTHKLGELLGLAGLVNDLKTEVAGDTIFAGFWGVASQWNEGTRYSEWNQQQATLLVTAIADPNHGVLRWLRARW